MKLLEYFSDTGPRLGAMQSNGDIVDVGALGLPARMLDLIAGGQTALDQLRSVLDRGGAPTVNTTRLLAPLPNPPKLLCVAANYREHIQESGFVMPSQSGHILPQFFAKFPSTCIIGPDEPIPLTDRNVVLDWEVELAVILGRRLRNANAEDAMAGVFGCTIANDISERKLNSEMRDREIRSNDTFFDWLTGKWFDGSLPLGPLIVTADEIGDPQKLPITLRVNGELMQNSTTAHMIFGVAELISYISGIVTLEPGDIIATGTPAGVGVGRGLRLNHGDRVSCEIAGIGKLENPVERRP